MIHSRFCQVGRNIILISPFLLVYYPTETKTKQQIFYTFSVAFCLRKIVYVLLNHWGRATHICVSKQTIIGSDNGLSPGQRQAIIWTNAGILLIGPMGTNLSEILIEIYTFSLTKMRLKMSSAKCRPFFFRLQCDKTSIEFVPAGSAGNRSAFVPILAVVMHYLHQ